MCPARQCECLWRVLVEGPAKYQSDVRNRGSASFSLNDLVRCRDFSSLRATQGVMGHARLRTKNHQGDRGRL